MGGSDKPTPELDATAPAGAGELAAGATFGHFQVVGVLGRGGMGAVMEAFDPELDRRVAIKVLHSDVDARADLVREAQAMAKLAHPNVVAVYEVGRSDENVFVVMELVDGQTLRAWIDARPRPWREILAMFVAAGRGLVAAHEAGLVHRDFKPENVLIGTADARPRVSDFGLATPRLGPGHVAGTPAYMAPEQWSGAAIDARADQFAFCVALWSALWGVAPFAGDTAPEVREAVIAGKQRPVPDGAGPRWLVAAVQRGLAVDPAKRWPSLAALLAELERGVARRRRAVAVVVAAGSAVVLAGIATAIALAMGGGAAAAACDAPTARVAAAWSPARRAAVQQHLVAIDPTDGAKRFVAVAAVLDRDVGAWSSSHVAACVATRDGAQSGTLLDLRMRCLDAWLARATGIADLLEHARTPREIEDAVVGARQIGDVIACDDTAALAAVVTPPPAAIRGPVEALRAELDVAEQARTAGHFEKEPAQSLAFVARARAFDYPPILAAALHYRVRVQSSRHEPTGAIATSHELVDVAAKAHDDKLAADTWLALVGALVSADHAKEAVEVAPAARAAVTRAGDDSTQRAMLLWREGAALYSANQFDAGIAKLDDARALCVKLGADQLGAHLLPLLDNIDDARGDAFLEHNDRTKAIAAFRTSIAESEAAFGPDNADETFAMNDLSIALLADGKAEESLATARHVLAIKEARFGETMFLAPSLGNIASALRALNRKREALDINRREQHLYLIDPAATPKDIAGSYLELAVVEDDLHDDAAALADYSAAIAGYEPLIEGTEDLSIANAFLNRGEFLQQHGRCKDALPDLERAMKLVEGWRDNENVWLVQPLEFIGLCKLQLGHPSEAIAPLEHALTFTNLPAQTANAHDLSAFYLARAHYALGRPGALAEAKAARDALVARDAGEFDSDVPPLDAWLAHPSP